MAAVNIDPAAAVGLERGDVVKVDCGACHHARC
jgi:hypothetical protein